MHYRYLHPDERRVWRDLTYEKWTKKKNPLAVSFLQRRVDESTYIEKRCASGAGMHQWQAVNHSFTALSRLYVALIRKLDSSKRLSHRSHARFFRLPNERKDERAEGTNGWDSTGVRTVAMVVSVGVVFYGRGSIKCLLLSLSLSLFLSLSLSFSLSLSPFPSHRSLPSYAERLTTRGSCAICRDENQSW